MTDTRHTLCACPFCGGTDTNLLEAMGEFWVLCETCKSHGKATSNERSAVLAWNTRAAQPPPRSSAESVEQFPDENILPDNYPIYGDYLYVADGKVYRSDWHGITVKRLKAREGFKEVRRCNIYARKAAMEAARG